MSNKREAKESFSWETKQKRIPNSRLLYHTKLYRVKGAGAYVSIRKPHHPAPGMKGRTIVLGPGRYRQQGHLCAFSDSGDPSWFLM